MAKRSWSCCATCTATAPPSAWSPTTSATRTSLSAPFIALTAAYRYSDLNLALPGEEPLRVQGAAISSNMFSLLGVNPILGRAFLPEEEQWGRHRSVLLSYSFWQTRLGGDRSVIGRSIHSATEDLAIVGGMPKGMPFFDHLPGVDLLVPFAYVPQEQTKSR